MIRTTHSKNYKNGSNCRRNAGRRIICRSNRKVTRIIYAREVLTEIENANFYVEMEKGDKAKEALKKGKQLVRDRVKLIRLADGENMQTIKEFKNGACGVDEACEKRWKSVKAVKEREDEKAKAKYRA